jgi:archaemetzincin
VSREIQRRFRLPTEIVPLLKDVDFAFDPVRNQFHSTKILEELADKAPRRSIKVLAVVQVDLFIPILTHVYGEAQLDGRAAVVSTNRLGEGLFPVDSHSTFYRRVAKEAVHELGHCFGLRHCRERTCIMHYCRTLKDVDQKSNDLCRYCKVLLQDEVKRLAEKRSASLKEFTAQGQH